MNTTKNLVQIFYTVPNYYAAALCLGDFSGLNDSEEREINEFIEAHGACHFHFDFDTPSYFSHRNDINNLGGEVSRVFLLINL